MSFAVEIPADDHAAALEVLAEVTHWHIPPGRRYHTAEANLSHPLLKGASRAFFIKMTPGSDVYPHRDPPGVVDFYDTDHIVCSTNPQSFIGWEDNGKHTQHLEHGKRYRINDRSLLHWATNDGETDRIHLLIEFPKLPPS